MPEHYPLLVPGATGAGHTEVVAPFDGAPIATVEQADRAGVEQALATASSLFRDRDAWLSADRRIDVLGRTVHIMHQRREELALEAAREGGKPLVDSLIEVDRAIDGVKLCIEYLRTQAGTEIPMGLNPASAGRLAFTRHEPIGPVLAFSAFNHPLNLIVHQAGPALAVGCPVIVKPAAATPTSCWRFVQILYEAGLPPEWCQVLLTADHELATEMVADRRVGFLSFIGSGRVGWMLRSHLAPGARCALEHGGVAPVIVAADADLDDALPLLAKAGFYHAGQVCVSVQRVFADRAIAHKLAERLAEKAKALEVGDPTLPGTEVGPLIRHSELQRVDGWVQEAVAGGAELLCGGKAISESCYQPTVLFDPPPDSRVMTHEVFGPVVCVSPFDAIDDAIAAANSLPYAFQASVFTRDLDTALRVDRRLNASAVMVNDHTAFRVDWMPFAGLRESGLGVGGIPYTMEDMQIKKLTVIRSREL
ncbi:MAG: aldehyde dehydrogenase family protein [Candidatus Nealsonbacteria bacterium]|nr:aldehyde dehydrogenase family protein [Candidatus Nealsonbacteria bacterium]